MKKVLSFVLVFTLLLSLSIVPGYAQGNKIIPPGLAKKDGGLPPGLAKKFIDIDGFEWARNAIEKIAEKGIIKGVGDDRFEPSKPVTKVEAWTMIIKEMGWDDEANEISSLISLGKKENKFKGKVQDWGLGYVNLAYEKGLFDKFDKDLKSFHTPAKRQDIARYIVLALNMEDNISDQKKPLSFKDASEVAQDYVEYVRIINQLGIMIGSSNNTFQPNKPVTRAEMAIIIDKLDEIIKGFDDDFIVDENRVTGVITYIDKDEIEIQVNNKKTTYDLMDDDLEILDANGDYIRFSSLKKGMTVKLYLEEKEVLKIQIVKNVDDEVMNLSGDITRILNGTTKVVTVKSGNKSETFTVSRDTDIELDGKDISFGELVVGMSVQLHAVHGKLMELYAVSFYKDYEGTLKSIQRSSSEISITIRVGREDVTIPVAEDVEITIDGDDANFADLISEVGSTINLETKNNVVTKIIMD